MSESQPSSATRKNSKDLRRRYAEVLGKRSLLGTLIGWESIRRTMRREDDLADADARAHHKALHGEALGAEEDVGDFSGNLVLGDMHVHRKNRMGKLAKAALLAAGLLAAGGIGAAGAIVLGHLLRGDVVESGPDADTQYEIVPLPGR